MLEKPKKLCKTCNLPIKKTIKNKRLIGISNYCSIECFRDKEFIDIRRQHNFSANKNDKKIKRDVALALINAMPPFINPKVAKKALKVFAGKSHYLIPPSKDDVSTEMIVTKVDKKSGTITVEKKSPSAIKKAIKEAWGVPLHKEFVERDREYLEFVHNFRCCVCGSDPVHAHHCEHLGMGKKGSDYSCIALCVSCHTEIHNIGINNFIDAYHPSFDPQQEQIKLLRKYIQWLKEKK